MFPKIDEKNMHAMPKVHFFNFILLIY
jgi:hypothetical protein